MSTPESMTTPNINFNPVIKVITDGNDNSQGFETSNIPTSVTTIDPQTQQFQQNMNANMETIEEQPIETKMDFNQPIIVKKQ